MRLRKAVLALGLAAFAAAPAFAGNVNLVFNFGGPDMELGPSQNYTSNGATITAYGYECSAPGPESVSTLSSCSASNLYQSPGGLGLAAQSAQEIGWQGPNADFVIGLDLSDLFSFGVQSVVLSFSNVGPGQAWAALGYPSDPFTPGATIQLGGDTKAWSEVDTYTFEFGPDDPYLILISSCGASSNPTGPCGSYLSPIQLTASTLPLATVPEPGTLALLSTGLLALGFVARRRWVLAQNSAN